MGFSKLKIQSKAINWIAASSFAVFLLHCNPNVLAHYVALFQGIHANYPGIYYWIISIPILALIFLVAIFVDQLRKWMWNKVWHYVEFRIHNKRKHSN